MTIYFFLHVHMSIENVKTIRPNKDKEKNMCQVLSVIFLSFLRLNTILIYIEIGPIFLRRFKLYMFSFTFGFMFANICFEKNQNGKIYVMFIINITWNETGICSFWAACLGSQGSKEKSSFNLCKFGMLSINMNH